MPPPPGMRQRNFCATGSHAISAPLLPVPGSGSGPITGRLFSRGVGIGRTNPLFDVLSVLASNLSSLANVQLLPVFPEIYTSPVAGLNDMGDQLCAPPADGKMVTRSRAQGRPRLTMGRPLLRSSPLPQLD